jgi:small subunit ribosomal protein S4
MKKKKLAGTTDQSSKKNDKQQTRRRRKISEYGRQLEEKQKVKMMYGVREKQFKRFFNIAVNCDGSTGEILLSLLERRLDNTLFRLKLATTRAQARQIVVHGHILVNGKKVDSPSYIVSLGDEVSLKPNVLEKKTFLSSTIDKRLNISIKVPDWLELDKPGRCGRILRNPARPDIQTHIEEHLIVELYSK